jgi:hypothetical protein
MIGCLFLDYLPDRSSGQTDDWALAAPRSVLRHGAASFQCPKIRGAAGEAIRNVRQLHTGVNRGRSRFELEVDAIS